MSENFRALRVGADGVVRVASVATRAPEPGEVSIDVTHSSLNFKDALAITGRGKILRRVPLTAGIDAAGRVRVSTVARFKAGDAVLVTGGGIGETEDGGLAERLVTRADHVIALPPGLDPRGAMILGTAGFTAALAFDRMTQNGQTPAFGPILINGASGGVGQFAVNLFAREGYDVTAFTGKQKLTEHLRALGARDVITPDQLRLGARPLESVRFGGAVDAVGGPMLAQILAHVQPWGNVAAIGLAAGAEFPASVMPFILRGVSLLGISSTNAPLASRERIWAWLARAGTAHLERFVSQVIGLNDVPRAANEMLERRTFGRVLVEMGRRS